METSQNLAIESFSFNWLTTRKLCFDSLSEHPFQKSFEFSEEKPSEVETTKPSHNSIFHFPTSKSHTTIVHADEIFSHGVILPKYSDRANKEVFGSSYSAPSSPNTSFLQRNHSLNNRVRARFLRTWRKMSKKILQKYFPFFKPLCSEVGCTRRNIKVDDFDGKYRADKTLNNCPQILPKLNYVKNWSETKRGTRKIRSTNNSPLGSPPRFPSYNSSDLSVDLSIDEAILHCKESLLK